MKHLMELLCCTCVISLTGADFREAPEKYWDFAKLKNPPAYMSSPFPDSRVTGLQDILFEGVPVQGKKAPVFAYIGYPSIPMPEGGYPGIVLVHGGGGTAFPEYTKLWTEHGFAVIAIDWYNRRPYIDARSTGGESGIQTRELEGGMRQLHVENAANMVLAHSLLRSLPKVNPERIVFVGLSWGSWYGAMVAAIDPRFKGVIEIYCGDARPEIARFIDGRFLHAAKVPMYWIASTHDQNVTVASLQRGFDECPTIINRSLVIQLPHSHIGFTFPACFRMADYFLKDAPPLPKLGKPVVRNGMASVEILGEGKGIKETIFCWTGDGKEPSNHKRTWHTLPAERNGNTLSVKLPDGIFQGFFSAYDETTRFHDCCGSSDVLFFPQK